jgi:Tfp pilus assembly protein PilP
MRVRVIFIAVLITVLFAFYGCESPPPPKPKPVVQKVQKAVDAFETEMVLKGTKFEDGYLYEQRNRRDPFIALIVPTKKTLKKEEKIGTLEGYDLNEFVLAAIAKRGDAYYALLSTPDNRSFTVIKGNIIGLNEGRVEDILEDKIVFVEYSRDYRGELKPKKITLEFVKGEAR